VTNTSRDGEALRARRAELARQFDGVGSASELFEFQRAVADEIRSAEPVAFRDRASPEREHLKLMRLFGDTIAHATLHTHTIQQLSKHPGKPPPLSHGVGFNFVLKCAALVADAGYPVRICDVTNVLKTADLVIGNPETPSLIECASDGGPTEPKGRKARQLARMEAVRDILMTGEGFVPGTLAPVKVLNTSVRAEHNWDLVENAARQAQAEGVGVFGTDGEIVCAVRSDSRQELELWLSEEAHRLTADFHEPLCALVSSRLDDPLPTVPPPLGYPIPLDLRLCLLERDIRLIHVIDVAAFLEIEHDGVRVTELLRDRHGNLMQPPFVFESANGVVGACSSRFLDEVLFGFVTIESSAKTMLSGVDEFYEAEGVGHEGHVPTELEDLILELKKRVLRT
jgi:hypothetical protein